MPKGWRKLVFTDDELPKPSAPIAEATAPVAGPPPMPVASATGSVKASMLAQVRKSVFNKNTAYVRLLDLADKMKAAIPDETMRLKAAIPVAGVTGTDIKSAIMEHTQALHDVRSAFSQDAQRNRASKIDSKKARRQVIATRIAELEQELGRLRTEDSQLAGAVAIEETQFLQTEADFAATVAQMQQELDAAARKLETLFT
jgi:predicted  nucleic acid-binding Zn-ribbon protein